MVVLRGRPQGSPLHLIQQAGHLRFTSHVTQLTTHHSQLTIHDSRLTTHEHGSYAMLNQTALQIHFLQHKQNQRPPHHYQFDDRRCMVIIGIIFCPPHKR